MRCLAKSMGTQTGDEMEGQTAQGQCQHMRGGLECSPELAKPGHAKPGCSCAFSYFPLMRETES